MTNEPPRRPRPQRAYVRARLASLLATVQGEDTAEVPAVSPAPPDSAGPGDLSGEDPDPPTDTVVPPPAVTPDLEERRPHRGARLGTAVFAVALLLLVVAIPTLGYIGARTLRYSRAGQVLNPITDPRAPGYIAIVDSTPTALVVQRDAMNVPISLTVIGLGAAGGKGGGSVLFVPLDTLLLKPVIYINRVRTAYKLGGERVMVKVVSALFNISFDSVIDLGDAEWAHLVAPVAPLPIDNPDSVDGFPAGRLALTADQVGPYLAAQRRGESDLNRLIRSQLVWHAWLHAVAASKAADPVPNGPDDTLSPFVRTLAAGPSTVDTLDVTPFPPGTDGVQVFAPNPTGIRNQITDAVPSPLASAVGSRYTVRLLNGVNGNPISKEVVRLLVYNDAQIGQIGNAKRFGVTKTTIQYHDPKVKKRAQRVADLFGGGTLVFDPKSNEAVDLIVVLGSHAMEVAARAGAGGG